MLRDGARRSNVCPLFGMDILQNYHCKISSGKERPCCYVSGTGNTALARSSAHDWQNGIVFLFVQ